MADLHNMNREQWIAALVETAKRVGANVTETPHGLKVIAMYPGELAKLVEACMPVPVESLGWDADGVDGLAGDASIVREYVEARGAYEAAIRPPGMSGFAHDKRLSYGDPVLRRWHAARAALSARFAATATQPKPAEGGESDIRAVIDRGLWGVVANAGRLSNTRKPRWGHVVDATALGPQSSIALCRRFGFDPDEYVGGMVEEDEGDDHA